MTTYLRCGMRLDETARQLFVHPNTLRNRLTRYCEMTGIDLRSVRDLTAVWWAFERRRVSLPSAGADH